MRLPLSKLFLRASIAGFALCALLLALLLVGAFFGSLPATQVLVTIVQPDANPLSMLLQTLAPRAFESDYSQVAMVLFSAWLQFGLIASALIAAGYSIFSQRSE